MYLELPACCVDVACGDSKVLEVLGCCVDVANGDKAEEPGC